MHANVLVSCKEEGQNILTSILLRDVVSVRLMSMTAIAPLGYVKETATESRSAASRTTSKLALPVAYTVCGDSSNNHDARSTSLHTLSRNTPAKLEFGQFLGGDSP